LGEKPHARIQSFFIRFFGNHEDDWQIFVFPEQRVQVSPNHYRVAEICVVRAEDSDPTIVRTPPLLCIEVLSRDGTLGGTLDRAQDYIAMGVTQTWVIDPIGRQAFMVFDGSFAQPNTGELTVPGTPIRVGIAVIFADLDKTPR
jgi:Uma2 family endonuclease